MFFELYLVYYSFIQLSLVLISFNQFHLGSPMFSESYLFPTELLPFEPSLTGPVFKCFD